MVVEKEVYNKGGVRLRPSGNGGKMRAQCIDHKSMEKGQ